MYVMGIGCSVVIRSGRDSSQSLRVTPQTPNPLEVQPRTRARASSTARCLAPGSGASKTDITRTRARGGRSGRVASRAMSSCGIARTKVAVMNCDGTCERSHAAAEMGDASQGHRVDVIVVFGACLWRKVREVPRGGEQRNHGEQRERGALEVPLVVVFLVASREVGRSPRRHAEVAAEKPRHQSGGRSGSIGSRSGISGISSGSGVTRGGRLVSVHQKVTEAGQ